LMQFTTLEAHVRQSSLQAEAGSKAQTLEDIRPDTSEADIIDYTSETTPREPYEKRF